MDGLYEVEAGVETELRGNASISTVIVEVHAVSRDEAILKAGLYLGSQPGIRRIKEFTSVNLAG